LVQVSRTELGEGARALAGVVVPLEVTVRVAATVTAAPGDGGVNVSVMLFVPKVAPLQPAVATKLKLVATVDEVTDVVEGSVRPVALAVTPTDNAELPEASIIPTVWAGPGPRTVSQVSWRVAGFGLASVVVACRVPAEIASASTGSRTLK
jgi:hypothetical protein